MGGDAPIGFFIGGLLGGIMGMMIGGAITVEACRERAVNAGVAFYSVDPATGETKFQYKTPTVAP